MNLPSARRAAGATLGTQKTAVLTIARRRRGRAVAAVQRCDVQRGRGWRLGHHHGHTDGRLHRVRHGELRHGQRHGDSGLGLHGRLGNPHLRRRRHEPHLRGAHPPGHPGRGERDREPRALQPRRRRRPWESPGRRSHHRRRRLGLVGDAGRLDVPGGGDGERGTASRRPAATGWNAGAVSSQTPGLGRRRRRGHGERDDHQSDVRSQQGQHQPDVSRHRLRALPEGQQDAAGLREGDPSRQLRRVRHRATSCRWPSSRAS